MSQCPYWTSNGTFFLIFHILPTLLYLTTTYFSLKNFFLEKKYDSLEALKREPSRQLIFRQ